jgi:hypothetical protein
MVASKRRKRNQIDDTAIVHVVGMLRAHLVECRICAGAVRAKQWGAFCGKGVECAAKVALGFNVMLETKRLAGPNHMGMVYPCPEISAHGEAYALTAELLTVVGVQGILY